MIYLAIICTALTLVPIFKEILIETNTKTMRQRVQNSVDEIIQRVSNFTGISIEEMKGRSRKRPIVIARQVAMYLIHQNHFDKGEGVTWKFIAECLGREHATAMWSISVVKNAIETGDKDVLKVLEGCTTELKEVA
jgi:chromosomal replication initiator protein